MYFQHPPPLWGTRAALSEAVLHPRPHSMNYPQHHFILLISGCLPFSEFFALEARKRDIHWVPSLCLSFRIINYEKVAALI